MSEHQQDATSVDLCIACGEGEQRTCRAEYRVEHNGQTRLIEDERSVCDHCGQISYVGDQISRHELAVAAAIREIDGLLSADELRAFRTRYCLKQTDLEAMLSTGPKTWTRWERGKVPQSKTADKLVRLLAANPGVVRKLMSEAKVSNPEAEAAVSKAESEMLTAAVAEAEKALGDRSANEFQNIFGQGFKAGSEVRILERVA